MPERDANQLAADATTARRGIISALIAVKGHLDQPYPDDDRWTPWTRFVEPALQRLDESVKELVALVGTLQQERDDALAALHPHSAAVVLKAARADAAEAALATTRQALTEIEEAARQGKIASEHVRVDQEWPVHDTIHRFVVLRNLARRALAATGGDTAPDPARRDKEQLAELVAIEERLAGEGKTVPPGIREAISYHEQRIASFPDGDTKEPA